ncbi:50S ribosomal protein L21 [Candidatus Peregrinibacteria bacterium]|nr:50S ribosomal protein L21 [Candidatus Peregrinibacteria bacterium]
MFAIVEIEGNQHKVKKGDMLTVEKIKNHKAGDKMKSDKVLLKAEGSKVEVGVPYLPASSVEFSIKEYGKDDKIRVFKKKAKKRYVRVQGHRQQNTTIEITNVK